MKKIKKKSKIRRILLGIFGGLFLCLLIALFGLYLYLRPFISEFKACRNRARIIAAKSSAADFKISETSFVYAADGSVISSLKGERNSFYLEYEDIPEYAKQCMIVTEDRDFYKHSGYDVKAILAAAKSYMEHGEVIRGGSTITQQLARNIYLSMEVTVERKTTEIFLAMELEQKYSKNKILEYYLNNIYFANGYYGLEAAAVGYFGVNSSELDLSEIAFLCAIPNNPTKYDPLKNMENTLARRDKILKQLLEFGGLSIEEYEKAAAKEIVLNPTVLPKQNYEETFSYYCAIRALMEKNGFVFRNDFADETDKEAYDKLYYEQYYAIQRTLFTGGYRIYTSIEPGLQERLQNAVNTELAGFDGVNEAGIYELQGSAVCIDNETGRVVAIVGGREQESSGYTLNRAYQSFRQTGSAAKPLIVYTPLLELGKSPNERVMDAYFEGGPRNAGGYYYGDISMREAVIVSANTVAWKLFMELTPEKGLEYLKRMNFSHLVKEDYVPAASLGGFTYGASALEMAAGFATLENDGVYRNPTCIVTIRDSAGNILVEDYTKGTRIYGVNSARCMTDILKDVMTKGTGWRLKLENAISAGKTGTATGEKDGWFIGYTAYYTTAVWVGYDYPKTLNGLTGSSYPGSIWKTYMDPIHEGLALKDFPKYEEADNNTGTEVGGDDNEGGYYPMYNAFGEPLDPETGLPYPTPVIKENEEDDN